MNNRVYAIDVLRCLAMVGMVLSGQIFHNMELPAWLFHAQTPPPDFGFDPTIAGITWVDLVFPFFLFSMGAAFPLSLGRKIDKGVPTGTIAWGILKRGLLLVFFAVMLGNTGVWLLDMALGNLVWSALLTLVVWGAFFALFIRLPRLSNCQNSVLNLCGAAVLVGIWFLYQGLGVEVSVAKSDIIILILATVVVFGSLLWWFTRRNLQLRLAVIALIVALKISSSVDGSWNQALWSWTFEPTLFQMEFLQYLCIVLPGTIAGDVIVKWLDRRSEHDVPTNPVCTYVAAGLIALLCMSNMWGLFTRHLIANLLLSLLLGGGAWLLLKRGKSASDSMLLTLFGAGLCWLLLGLVLEAFEGGIKKDYATLSYFFVTSGLAFFVVVVTLVLLEYRHLKAGFLVCCGQNPMIAYTAAGYVVVPLLLLFSRAIPMPWLTGSSGCVMSVGRGIIITVLMMCLTVLFTKRKLFWRT